MKQLNIYRETRCNNCKKVVNPVRLEYKNTIRMECPICKNTIELILKPIKTTARKW